MRLFNASWPERVERTSMRFVVRGDQWADPEIRRRFETLASLTGKDLFPDVRIHVRDTADITWNLDIAYHNCVRQLQVITELLEIEDIWADVALWERGGGNILIREFIDALTEAQRRIAARA